MAAAKDRSPQARAAAHAMHAKHDSRKTSEAGRRAANDRFEKEVRAYAAEHGEQLTDEEAARRAEHARKSYMLRLAHHSARVRRARKKGDVKAIRRSEKALKALKDGES